ncbi:hypothetical protein DICVIV_10127 [Dictyocaulus viviparus]|uniref:Conserved oligomeric Golgi complex subunit 7 n=1 Tax=Dictyocaulus viviparus TaxID=29172 RepID=A0A0D8XGS9_DICVI|nr:hypothetical protein DICVIV_10127 [Dictyocaulus viviparus]
MEYIPNDHGKSVANAIFQCYIAKQVRNSATDFLSSLCEGQSREERRKILNEHLTAVQKQYDTTVASIEKAKANIEEARVKYENMNDMVLSLEQLKSSLEHHIRTAKSQWERARETLKEDTNEDHQKMCEGLADMQASQKILSKLLSKGFDDKEFEEMKDRFLAWQSAALIFAIQQADFDRLGEIQKTYESLGRMNEFISIFRRVSINEMRELSTNGDTIQSIITSLYKGLEFTFTHHHKVLCRFLNEEEATSVLSSAIEEGLNELDFSLSFTNIISADENPIELIQKIVLTIWSEVSLKAMYPAEIYSQVKDKIVRDLANPFRSALTTYVLAKINAFDFENGSFRLRVDALKSSIAELLHFMTDVFVQCEALFGHDVKNVAQQSLDKALENFMVKMNAWEPWLESHYRTRPIEDVVSVCASSGQLVFGLQEFKSMILNIELKWNRWICNFVIKAATEKVVHKMMQKMNEIEFLQLFHLWEQFFLDENVVHAFYIALKRKYEGDELFRKTVANVANNIISEFVTCVGDPMVLSREAAKQFHIDTIFLKDAFEDLRTGDTTKLSELEGELMRAITMS